MGLAARATVWLTGVWRTPDGASNALRPLAALYGAVVALRRRLYAEGWLTVHRLPVPVVVVGNRVAGGAGKTPTVMAVVRALRDAGRTPGIVSRGYGRSGSSQVIVESDTDPARAGDEPLLLRRRTGAPVVVDADRVGAAHALLQAHPDVDVIVADDGLQHLALGRDVEVLLFDERGVGNGRLLPAGPLREPLLIAPDRSGAREPTRLVLYNAPAPTTPLPGWISTRRLAGVQPLADWRAGRPVDPAAWSQLAGRRVLAVAGVAVPARFFAGLRAAGLDIEERPLADHHDYAALPWPSTAGDVVVTEKDAVKIAPGRTLGARVWVAPLDFEPEAGFFAALLQALPPEPSPHGPIVPPEQIDAGKTTDPTDKTDDHGHPPA